MSVAGQRLDWINFEQAEKPDEAQYDLPERVGEKQSDVKMASRAGVSF